MLRISGINVNFYKFLKNDITEIQWIFELKFFQTNDITFVAPESKILYTVWWNLRHF